MNYKDLSVSELAKLISPNSAAFQQLKYREILRTKNVVGELGEFYAIEFYCKNPKFTQSVHCFNNSQKHRCSKQEWRNL